MIKENLVLTKMSEEEWEDFRSIRLEALRTNPSVFLSSYDSALSQDEEYWRSQLRSDANAIFLLKDGKTPVGLTGAFRYRESPEDTVVLGMSFLRPEYRGCGLSALFYEARIKWAKEQDGINRIIVSHRAGNEASRGANQKFGFVFCEVIEADFPDGTRDFEYKYELRW